MNILGISCYYHDAAAALLVDGRLAAAAEEERFTRKKHDHNFPTHAIDFCMKQANISAADLDYVVFYEKPLIKFERIMQTALYTFPKSWGTFRESMVAWFNEKLWIKGQLQTRIGVPTNKILFIEHHLSHAASAMFCSPYQDAAVLTIDGVGEWTTAAIGQA
ncbi:MAG TPA: carbamoyltransferase N-terminal domain-containing protein, partial [Anaerolineae bacterium]|nr:carbamoyltransferase N-terminal domain-containing protein [Anaerolineae bacterium]